MVEKKVSPGVEVVNSTKFECGLCGFETNNLNEHNEHLRLDVHPMTFGNYPCPRCKKQVTVVPDFIDKPSPDSGLPENNHDNLSKRFNMVKKRPSLASVRGNAGYCDDCKAIVRKELE